MRENERVRVHNEINLPQAKLDSEISASFLLNEQGNLYFLLHNNSVHNLIYRKEKKIYVKECAKPSLCRKQRLYRNALRPRRFK